RRLQLDPARGARLPPGRQSRIRRALVPRWSGCGILRPRPRGRLRPRRRAADALPAQRLAASARPTAPLRLGLERLPTGHRARARLGHAAGIAARGCRTRRVRRARPRRPRRRGAALLAAVESALTRARRPRRRGRRIRTRLPPPALT